jgi:regulatory protein
LGEREEVRAAALRLLARREHSARELRRKLRERGHLEEFVDAVLAELERERLLDDARFADALIASRIGRGQGPMRLLAELRERGVAEAIAEQALAEAECDWTALAATVRRKRFGAAAPTDYPQRAKQARFLQYRGFTSEQIRHALGDDGTE